MEVLVKVSSSEFYDGADYALLDITQDLIETVWRGMAAARNLAVTLADFAYLEMWDYSPAWFEFGPDHLDALGMEEDEFYDEIEGDGNIIVPPSRNLMPVMGTVSTDTSCLHLSVTDGKVTFRWTAYDKHTQGVGRLQTYSMDEDDLRAWAKELNLTLIGA